MAASASPAHHATLSLPPDWMSAAATVVLATSLGMALLAWIDARMKRALPTIQMQPTPFNNSVMPQCPSMREVYKPVPFLTNCHVETIMASFYRSKPDVTYWRECLHMGDGGTVALDWEFFKDPSTDLPEDAPVLVLLPGLTGGSSCSYVLHAVKKAKSVGIRAVVFNSRGTAESPVTSPQFYSASYTGDMRAVVEHVSKSRPKSLILAAGWSLGANILLRYLGEEGSNTRVTAAVSMCNPFDLTISNANFTKGFNKIYDQNLANGLTRIFAKHEKVWRKGAKEGSRPESVATAKTIRDFDDAITIHSYGWESVDAYYAGSSSSLSIPHLKIPVLFLQALDDPIAPKEAIPYKDLAANKNCVLVCSLTGGHLGWVCSNRQDLGQSESSWEWIGAPWSDQVMCEWLQAVIKAKANFAITSAGHCALQSNPPEQHLVGAGQHESVTNVF
ncbi:hypothetical protein CEUSTIGMA_g6298.t1 [Chlamydomonas eustigma]|uniref:AB hydrolase-1 domain-containing protein n=1 Tax=Chlamydomonas eustigma TaxID=1157962 RepID=A0A250X7W9_9CHLO|nr:hypothetical protein CEUSTIGMA_g6298.t1 [Chlamydomonas eustigma]|eukprot:GAX78860.1 hypothetical protein CEUSTIGMA_g6298.t1 [Chlamydomonas eustigma]